MHEFKKYWHLTQDYQLRCAVLKNTRTAEYYCRVQMFALIGGEWQPVGKETSTKVLQTRRGRSYIVHRFNEKFKHVSATKTFYIEDLKDLK